jgi:hypothetical protein
MVLGKPMSLPKSGATERCSFGETIALPTNIRLIWIGLPRTNALAYLEAAANYGPKQIYKKGSDLFQNFE